MRHSRLGIILLTFPIWAQSSSTSKPVYLSYEEVRPILAAMADILPPELKDLSSTAWSQWVKRRDSEIRARLVKGDEDSVLNLLLFGTSYTRQPRIALEQLRRGQAGQLLQARADDLIRGLAAPDNNERLLFLRSVAVRKGYSPGTPGGRKQLKECLLASLDRVIEEDAGYAKRLEAVRSRGDATAEFIERSKLFENRGLSLDTSLAPSFAIEESLRAMTTRGLLGKGTVRRAAVIGPGLDFADKQEGYDFYPQQTIQPFALIDTLLRLGLARPGALDVMTFDISPRINQHLRRARERAQHGVGYAIQLPRDTRVRLEPGVLHFWERFGEQIGAPAATAALPPGLESLKIRAVRVRPSIVRSIRSVDLNIVLQRLESPPTKALDLIVATNVFVYYGVLEQVLALANVERLLRPGGFLLSNNALLELPMSRVRSADNLTVVYSDRHNDGDHIVWYRRAVD